MVVPSPEREETREERREERERKERGKRKKEMKEEERKKKKSNQCEFLLCLKQNNKKIFKQSKGHETNKNAPHEPFFPVAKGR